MNVKRFDLNSHGTPTKIANEEKNSFQDPSDDFDDNNTGLEDNMALYNSERQPKFLTSTSTLQQSSSSSSLRGINLSFRSPDILAAALKGQRQKESSSKSPLLKSHSIEKDPKPRASVRIGQIMMDSQISGNLSTLRPVQKMDPSESKDESRSRPSLNGSNAERRKEIADFLQISFESSMRRKSEENRNKFEKVQKKARLTNLFNDKSLTIFGKKSDPKVSTRAIDIIQDKSFVETRTMRASILRRKVAKKEGPPKLLTILRKHARNNAQSIDESNGLVGLVGQVKKMKIGFFAKQKQKLQQVLAKLWQTRLLKPLNPDSRLIFMWDILMMIFILMDFILLPLRLFFADAFEEGSSDSVITSLETAQTIVFLIDIILNFHTAFQVDGNLVENHWMIATNYLKKWFWIDLISTFPYEWVSDALDDQAKGPEDSRIDHLHNAAQVFRVIKLIRIIRVVKLKQLLTKIKNVTYTYILLQGLLSLFKLCMNIFFLSHWAACIWYYIASSNDSENWVKSSYLDGASIQDKYTASLYFAVTTMMTVGYGDITPTNSKERVFAIFLMLMGGGVFGYTLNGISAILQSLEDERAKIRKNISVFARYMQKKGLAGKVQDEIKKYLEFVFEDEDTMNGTETTMFEALSKDLKDKVYEHLNGRLLYENKVIITNFTRKILYAISAKIEGKTYGPGENIADKIEGEFCIYYVLKGEVDFYLTRASQTSYSLKKGDHFGELSFFTNESRIFSAKSVNFSHLLFLRRDKFLQILEEFPEDREMFCMIKDKLMIYNDYSVLQLSCFVCEEANHPIESCPKLRYLPDTETVMEYYFKKQKFSLRSFKRKNRKKFHALENLKKLKADAKRMIGFGEKEGEEEEEGTGGYYDKEESDEEEDDNEHEEEIKMHEEKTVTIIDTKEGKAPKRSKTSQVPKIQSLGKFFNVSSGRKSPSNQKRRVSLMTLFNPSLGEFEVLLRKGDLAAITEEDIDELASSDESIRRILNGELERVRNFQVYFPHNNVTKVVEKMKTKARYKDGAEEINHLKYHLKRFFKAIDKESKLQKDKTQQRRRSSVSNANNKSAISS